LTQKVDWWDKYCQYNHLKTRAEPLETHVVNKQQPSSSSKEESFPPVTPSESGNGHRENESHNKQQTQVVVVLPPDDLVPGQVRDIGNSNLGTRLEDHPTDMSPPEPLVSRVWVKVGVGVTVVSSVTTGPPFDGSLDGSGSRTGETVLQRKGSGVRSVSPKSLKVTWKVSNDISTEDGLRLLTWYPAVIPNPVTK